MGRTMGDFRQPRLLRTSISKLQHLNVAQSTICKSGRAALSRIFILHRETFGIQLALAAGHEKVVPVQLSHHLEVFLEVPRQRKCAQRQLPLIPERYVVRAMHHAGVRKSRKVRNQFFLLLRRQTVHPLVQVQAARRFLSAPEIQVRGVMNRAVRAIPPETLDPAARAPRRSGPGSLGGGGCFAMPARDTVQ